MPQLYRVLYCSRNEIMGSEDAVRSAVGDILAVSRANNARDGITGGLLYSAGCFAQVLEGPYDTVQDAFERIQCDARHSEVTVLQSGPVATRDFPDWSMAFTGQDGASRSNGSPLDDAFAGRSAAGDGILTLLRQVVVRENEWLIGDGESQAA